jgi:hypothetical protein
MDPQTLTTLRVPNEDLSPFLQGSEKVQNDVSQDGQCYAQDHAEQQPEQAPPAETQGYAASFVAGDAAFLLRCSLYLRQTNGAAKIKTLLSNQPNVPPPLVVAGRTTRRSRDPRVLRWR